MSGLDIAALRLTKAKLMDSLSASPDTTVEAQLGKDLWGIQAWLGEVDLELAAELAQALEQANIERPTAEKI